VRDLLVVQAGEELLVSAREGREHVLLGRLEDGA
jgi:hypothetical protein